jgi:hypothetical protein
MKKLGFTVVPLDLHARPIGSDDRALIRRAVMPSHAVADFQSFGLVGCHDGILPVKAGQFHSDARARIYFGSSIGPTYGTKSPASPISLFALKGISRRRGSQGSAWETQGNDECTPSPAKTAQTVG